MPHSWHNGRNLKFNPNGFLDAALAGIGDGHNGGGPIWAIFDADAVAREKWDPKPPNVDFDAGFFFTADTIEDLAKKIVMKYQRVPMPPENLAATIARYNSFVDSGVDEDFGKPKPLYKIAKPPFYAGWATPVPHDTRAGLRINGKCQVVDMNGEVIPGPLLRRRDPPAASACTAWRAPPARASSAARTPPRRRGAPETCPTPDVVPGRSSERYMDRLDRIPL